MKQKYIRYQFVRVVRHDQYGNFDAIIKGSYADLYGGKDIGIYSVYKDEGGKVVDCLAWFDEDQLSLYKDQSVVRAAEMIEAYNLK